MIVPVHARLVLPFRATALRCLVIWLVIFLVVVVSECSRTAEPAQFNGPKMGTT